MWSKSVKVNGPYNFHIVLQRLSGDPLNVINMEERFIKVPLIIEGNNVVVTVKSIGTINDPQFIVSADENCNENIVVQKVTDIFGWNLQLDDIKNYFNETRLAPLFATFQGVPIIRDFEPYRCIITCIIHQQLNMKFARTLTERLVTTFGTKKGDVWFYPDAKTVSEITVDQLREMQFSTRKAEYVIEVSKLINEGKLKLDELEKLTDDEVINQLVNIRGIGPWTAENMLLFAYGRKDIFPVGDIGIQNALKPFYGKEDKPSKEEMLQWSKAWSPYRSYATLYLWLSIENHDVRSEW